ncbi:MAG: hypothetical protein ABSD20_12720 [Terriglobales bacterium]
MAALPIQAHVGSPDVYYEADAGPYHLFVTVQIPQVIPGVAKIQVRADSNDVRTISVVPMRLSGPGSELSPIPDVVHPSKQDAQLFAASLWLMESGALRVHITVDGARGRGELSVPVPAFARRTLSMRKTLGGVLLVLTLFLAVGLVQIIIAAVRDSGLEPGETPATATLHGARLAAALTAVVVVAILYLGNLWWNAEASSHGRDVTFYRPPAAVATVQNGDRLVIHAQGPAGEERKWSREVNTNRLLPDHGHLMHLFLISVPTMDCILHLHPEHIGNGNFAIDLPAMPAGKYQIFADIVDQNGFPWTLVGTVDLPAISGGPLAGDDSSWSGPAALSSPGNFVSELSDGGRMVWERSSSPLRAQAPMEFKFAVQDRDGHPVSDLEPYMGMAGHAEFVRTDFSVFAHVHPAGSVSMAALELAQNDMPGMMSMPEISRSLSSEVSFPYGFPQPGDYRIFVQVKRVGRVQTGVFDVHVE